MVKSTCVSYNIEAESRRRCSDRPSDRYYPKQSSAAAIVDRELDEFDVIPTLKTRHGGLTWAECVFEIFFSIQGPFFFILPHAFKQLGYVPSIVGTISISLLYTYILHTYMWCEREIKRQRNIPEDTNLSLQTMIDYTFFGSPARQRIAVCLKKYWRYEIILSWSLSVSLSELFISQNIQYVLQTYGYSMSVDQLLLALFPLTTLIAYIPNLKVLSTMAFLTTLVFILTMFLIMYTILVDARPLPSVRAFQQDLSNFPTFVATIMLTINITPLLFQLKHELKRRKDLEDKLGCVNVTMFILVVLNVCFSLFAYLRYGDGTESNVLENLPRTTVIMVANVCLTAALVCCNSISFFVVFETIWCGGGLSSCFAESRNLKMYEYFARTLTNLFVTAMAILVPTLEIFINLTSSFSCPFDSVFLPMLLQLMLISLEHKRDKRFYLYLVKTCVFLVLAVAFSITCFWKFVTDITEYYKTD